MSHRRTTASIDSLDAHPNAAEVRGILSQLPRIADAEVSSLADAWHNTTLLAEARRRALEPDSILVVEVLSCFDTVQSLFADEIRGEEDFLTVGPDVTATALKAIRDAIAAAYAQPTLNPTEHMALMRAWRTVYPTDRIEEPDLGVRADDVKALLSAMPRLAGHCHDASAAAEYASILVCSVSTDEDIRCAAREEAWHAAVLTSRRRLWHMIQRTATQSLSGYCPTCRHRSCDLDTARVLTLCVDAACGLLVAGALEDDIVDVLSEPVNCLMPAHRPASGG